MVIAKSDIRKAVASHFKKKYKGTFEHRKNFLGGEESLFRETNYGYNLVFTLFSIDNSYSIFNAMVSHTTVETIYQQFTGHNIKERFGHYPDTVQGDGHRPDGTPFDQPYAVPGSIETATHLTNSLALFDQYMEEVANPFFDRYSDLREILKFWDSLDGPARQNVYFPGPGKYMKALIISRLCNDAAYETKARDYTAFYQKKVDEGNNNYAKQLEQCTQLAEHLRTVQPLY
jgi:hypothetical protein